MTGSFRAGSSKAGMKYIPGSIVIHIPSITGRTYNIQNYNNIYTPNKKRRKKKKKTKKKKTKNRKRERDQISALHAYIVVARCRARVEHRCGARKQSPLTQKSDI